jgi:exodeoxyribonuclease-3
MLLLSWNVNGIRSAIKKGFLKLLESNRYDAILLQEVKSDYIPLELSGTAYQTYIFPARIKKGYSGTVSLSHVKPLSVIYGIGEKKFDEEGRVLTLEFEDFYLINAYFPNSRHGLTRIGFKLEFDSKILAFAENLRKKKPIVMCGDFNVAHEEIDIARPKENKDNAGFTKEERDWLTSLLELGYVDSYRLFESGGGHYTWWAYRTNARQRNIGWRIDYFIVSDELTKRISSADIMDKIKGSDHAPISLELDNGAHQTL